MPKSSWFYTLSKEERIRLADEAIAKRQTLVERWTKSVDVADGEAVLERWTERAGIAVSLLGEVTSVTDIGAAHMDVERLLPSGVVYVPLDVARRDDRTIVVDLNVCNLPNTNTDGAVMLGVLEYIYDVRKLLAETRKQYRVMVTTYNPVEGTKALSDRRAHAWVNNYSKAEITALMRDAGWSIDREIAPNAKSFMWRLV